MQEAGAQKISGCSEHGLRAEEPDDSLYLPKGATGQPALHTCVCMCVCARKASIEVNWEHVALSPYLFTLWAASPLVSVRSDSKLRHCPQCPGDRDLMGPLESQSQVQAHPTCLAPSQGRLSSWVWSSLHDNMCGIGVGGMEDYLDFFFFNSQVKKHAFDSACQVLAGNDRKMEKYRISKSGEGEK